MKLSHLSLAIFSAIALSACGGSSTSGPADDGMKEKDKIEETKKEGNEDQNKEEEKQEVTEEEKKQDQEIVDATKDEVVDTISLSKEQTYASQQYIRGQKSKHDRLVNPDKGDASTTVLSGVTLDEQNPQLTNIVIARVKGANSKGEEVRLSLYAGSENSNMRSLTAGQVGPEQTLQEINQPNSLVDSKWAWNGTGWDHNVYAGTPRTSGYAHRGYVDNFVYDFIGTAKAFNYPNSPNAMKDAYAEYLVAKDAYDAAVERAKEEAAKDIASRNQGAYEGALDNLATTTAELQTKATNLVNAGPSVNMAKLEVGPSGVESVKYIDATAVTKALFPWDDATLSTPDKVLKAIEDNLTTQSVDIKYFTDSDLEEMTKYGFGLYRAFENDLLYDARGFGDRFDGKKVVGTKAGVGLVGDEATHGLVAVYKQGKSFIARGLEDNNVRKSRIFGHYYLDPGSEDGLELDPEVFNSWDKAVPYITGVDADYKANKWGLGAVPMQLNHVQYGRVTARIKPPLLNSYPGTNGWQYVHQQDVNRDPSKEGTADDFYFYRGTGATTIEQMANLDPDVKINYEGHALMYGIDNNFHGKGQNLPNAFGVKQNYGLGNFVKGELDMAQKKFSGEVYNVWHRADADDVVTDTLVTFSGNVKGNTVIGNAERAYMEEDNPAILRASFYGANASEVGGAINAITNEEVYGPVKGDWGGVFGAKRTATGGSSWLVSSEKK